MQLAKLSDAHPNLLMVQAVRRIQATPGFTSKAAEAAAAYHKQRQQAVTAVELVRRRYAVPAGTRSDVAPNSIRRSLYLVGF